jgi:hypothetical protein
MISNHPTRLDWLFLWSLTTRLGTDIFQKIVLKRGLDFSPLTYSLFLMLCLVSNPCQDSVGLCKPSSLSSFRDVGKTMSCT